MNDYLQGNVNERLSFRADFEITYALAPSNSLVGKSRSGVDSEMKKAFYLEYGFFRLHVHEECNVLKR